MSSLVDVEVWLSADIFELNILELHQLLIDSILLRRYCCGLQECVFLVDCHKHGTCVVVAGSIVGHEFQPVVAKPQV
jgi:hypothetical protein